MTGGTVPPAETAHQAISGPNCQCFPELAVQVLRLIEYDHVSALNYSDRSSAYVSVSAWRHRRNHACTVFR